MNAPGLLLALAIAAPLALVASALWPAARARLLDLLPLAPLPALLAALIAPGGSLALASAPLRITLSLDLPGAMLLGGAALLWSMAGRYAASYMAKSAHRESFALWWLLTMSGSLGVFLVADLTSFYLTFSLASLAAYGLVSHERTHASARAAGVYMLLALLGEAFLLLAFVMLANGQPDGNLMIGEAVALLPASPWCGAILALLILGFGLKMGLVPLHVWMPLAHPVAPMPASAALSGIIVKAGIIGLIRFLPFDAGLADWGGLLIMLGLFTAFYGVAVGLTQHHPKVVLAYSTVSQMGVIGAVLGAGLAVGNPATGTLAAYYALHHLLVKGALFLGVGIAAGRSAPWMRALMALLALSLAGLPFTSGMLAKYAVKDLFGDGLALTLVTLSATGSTLLMLHFLRRLELADEGKPALALMVPWLAVAAASLVAVWALFPLAAGSSLTVIFGFDALWKATWPILLGLALIVPLFRLSNRLPRIPEGDIVVLAETQLPRLRRAGTAVEHADEWLRHWPVAGIILVLVILLLGAAMQLSAGFGPA